MVWVKERADSRQPLPVWVRHEHLARYQFASRFVAGKVVVDCACGDGTGSRIFAEAGAAMVHAFDVSAQAADANGFHERVRFAVGDATRLPLPNSFADVYISLETIEHVNEDQAVLREVARVLRPDGIFICSTPNRVVYNPGKSLRSKPWNPFHIREYSQSEFSELLSKYFGQIEWFGQNPRSPTTTRLFEALGRVLPMHGAVRLNQVCKLPRFLYDKPEDHRVLAGNTPGIFEYVVAVCRLPISTRPSMPEA
jgi:ubiquinone/menaquinone biosynthesis C-methylase UbiE